MQNSILKLTVIIIFYKVCFYIQHIRRVKGRYTTRTLILNQLCARKHVQIRECSKNPFPCPRYNSSVSITIFQWGLHELNYSLLSSEIHIYKTYESCKATYRKPGRPLLHFIGTYSTDMSLCVLLRYPSCQWHHQDKDIMPDYYAVISHESVTSKRHICVTSLHSLLSRME